MTEEEEYSERIAAYRSWIRRSPAHFSALSACLDKRRGELSEAEEIFLHVFAPSITAFAEWVLQSAGAAGIRRLYFLARDGRMPCLAARVLREKLGMDAELRYLQVSRYALRRAEYCLLGEACLDTLCVGGIGITFEKLMKRAALTDAEAMLIARLAGYEERYRCALQYAEIQRLKEILRKIPQFLFCVETHSRACLDDALGYLRQEGMTGTLPAAIVDSGWVGTTQQSLARLIGQAGGDPETLSGCYFGLFELPKGADRARYRSYYAQPERGAERKARFSICLFEAVCAAPEGMTMGYGQQGGQYIALENPVKNPNAGWIERFSGLLADYAHAYVPSGAGRKTAPGELEEALLSACMGRPTRTEARIFGGLLFCDDVLETRRMAPLAAVWDAEELKRQRFLRKLLVKAGALQGELKESGWPEGSIVNLCGDDPAACSRALRQERNYKRLMYFRKQRQSRASG